MKRPVTLMLLVVFAAVQLYFAKVPITHQVQGSTWIKVASGPKTLAQRQNHYYLVGKSHAQQLVANGVHITAKPHSINWVDVPEPSGQGIWHLAMGPNSLPLIGTGGPLFPAPNGQGVAWLDTQHGRLYYSAPARNALSLLSSKISRISHVLWAPDSQAIALEGRGPQGQGLYTWDFDNILKPAIIPGKQVSITQFGFSRQETLLAALSTGQVLWQGHGLVKLPRLSHIALSSHNAALIGLTPNHVVYWHHNQKISSARPNLKWIGHGDFSPNGNRAAIIGQSSLHNDHLLIYGGPHPLSISLPFSQTTAKIAGFVGSHWVLVNIPTGPHQGTYGWWIN